MCSCVPECWFLAQPGLAAITWPPAARSNRNRLGESVSHRVPPLLFFFFSFLSSSLSAPSIYSTFTAVAQLSTVCSTDTQAAPDHIPEACLCSRRPPPRARIELELSQTGRRRTQWHTNTESRAPTRRCMDTQRCIQGPAHMFKDAVGQGHACSVIYRKRHTRRTSFRQGRHQCLHPTCFLLQSDTLAVEVR